jgi:hypothetical protein
MADLTKPAEMSDVLWAALEDDFNGEDANAHKKYFTLGDVETEVAPAQEDLDNWHATVVAIEAPDATTAEEVTYHELYPEE